jgi:hypothetical protein
MVVVKSVVSAPSLYWPFLLITFRSTSLCPRNRCTRALWYRGYRCARSFLVSRKSLCQHYCCTGYRWCQVLSRCCENRCVSAILVPRLSLCQPFPGVAKSLCLRYCCTATTSATIIRAACSKGTKFIDAFRQRTYLS